jgi:hypothetical protein
MAIKFKESLTVNLKRKFRKFVRRDTWNQVEWRLPKCEIVKHSGAKAPGCGPGMHDEEADTRSPASAKERASISWRFAEPRGIGLT